MDVDFAFLEPLIKKNDSKIVLLVMDGLGGIPSEEGGCTELETASTPNLDALAARSICGLQEPIGPGIAPGSGPGHLALFGYDPVQYEVGRGALSAAGLGFDLTECDIAARGNFCTVAADGIVTDRRAGRIATEKNAELCDLLRSRIRLDGAEVFVQPEKDHRFLLALRGDGLREELTDTDPQALGVPPLAIRALAPEAERTASLVAEFVAQARAVLADEHPANMVLLRGFSSKPAWPSVSDVFGLRAAAIAVYPMYKGVAELVGMEVLDAGETLEEELATLEGAWGDYDFFYVHVKKIDSAGEDGDFAGKVALIEEVDKVLPRLLANEPDVIVVTGDHSTPAAMKLHSWHPVPVMIYSTVCRPDDVTVFSESACVTGALGPRMRAVDLMPLALANAGRLEKFGA
jgi:2,3-bisphosphoglycerate-independent phosphoglycerate mutase